MKKYSVKQAVKGKTTYRTPTSFILKKVRQKQIPRFWNLAARLQYIRKNKKK